MSISFQAHRHDRYEPIHSLSDLYRFYLHGSPDPDLDRVLSAAIQREFITIKDYARVFDFLLTSCSLPTPADKVFAQNITMWLEIINNGYFIPIITRPGRLNFVMDALLSTAVVAHQLPLSVIADVGCGHPSYTTFDLAQHFSTAMIHGFDIFEATYLLTMDHFSYAVFDEASTLLAVNSTSVERLHQMILDWDFTRDIFDRSLSQLRSVETVSTVNRMTIDNIEWKLIAHPNEQLRRALNRNNVNFHVVTSTDFLLAALTPSSVDLIWCFNCLLHYSMERRVNALSELGTRCRQGGFIIEGFTSPSGRHAIYQLWQRRDLAIIPIEYGWTLSNLRFPLWPLHDNDPQVKILGEILRHLRTESNIDPLLRQEMTTEGHISQNTVSKIVSYFSGGGLPTRSFDDRFIIHNTEAHLESFGLYPILVKV